MVHVLVSWIAHPIACGVQTLAMPWSSQWPSDGSVQARVDVWPPLVAQAVLSVLHLEGSCAEHAMQWVDCDGSWYE